LFKADSSARLNLERYSIAAMLEAASIELAIPDGMVLKFRRIDVVIASKFCLG
jgi:hypothetical protein